MKAKNSAQTKQHGPLKAVFLAFFLTLSLVAAPAQADHKENPDERRYFGVYRVVAEFKGPHVYTDGAPIDSPTGLQRTIWCTSCTTTQAWIWTTDRGDEQAAAAQTFGGVDFTNLGAAEEKEFKTLVFDIHAEVLVLPCTLNGEAVPDCYIVSGSTAWLTILDSTPDPPSCDYPEMCILE